MAIHTEEFLKHPFRISHEQALLLFRSVEVYIEQLESSMVGDFVVDADSEVHNIELTALENLYAAHELRDQLIEQFGIVYE